MMRKQQLDEVLDWVGHSMSDHQVGQLERLALWLDMDAREAGGIGPKERVWERHILDSLMFAKGFLLAPTNLVDLGGGVGLPSMPLAILFPAASITLIDRSTKRMRLARRACRVVGIENLRTEVGDILAIPPDSYDGAVMRAVLPPTEGAPLLRRVTKPPGPSVFGIGIDMFHVKHFEGEVVRFPGSEVLDPGRWIHIMQ